MLLSGNSVSITIKNDGCTRKPNILEKQHLERCWWCPSLKLVLLGFNQSAVIGLAVLRIIFQQTCQPDSGIVLTLHVSVEEFMLVAESYDAQEASSEFSKCGQIGLLHLSSFVFRSWSRFRILDPGDL
jgi:hypothetical protein